MASFVDLIGSTLKIHHVQGSRAYVLVRFGGDRIKQVSYADPQGPSGAKNGGWHSCSGVTGFPQLLKGKDAGVSFEISSNSDRDIVISASFKDRPCSDMGTPVDFPMAQRVSVIDAQSALGKHYQVLQYIFSLIPNPGLNDDHAFITVIMHDDDFGGS